MSGRDSWVKRIILPLLILNLVLSGVVLAIVIVEKSNESDLIDQYTLYIGTNDKDTNLQELALNECRARVESVCLQYVSGYTISEADGGWTDGAGNIMREKSLICCINGATAADIDSIVDQLLLDLNQSTIMVEHQRLSTVYHNFG